MLNAFDPYLPSTCTSTSDSEYFVISAAAVATSVVVLSIRR